MSHNLYFPLSVVYIEPGWTIRDLLKTVSFKLDMNPAAEIVFNKDGNITATDIASIFRLNVICVIDCRCPDRRLFID